MSLERNETARRFMEALLHAGEPQEIAKTVEIAVGCTDALLAALVPVAPASGAPATEPRRTVGAVVRNDRGREFIVVKPGVSPDDPEQRLLDEPIVKACAIEEDAFARWATKEECDRHGVPFVDRSVDRTTPAAALTEAERADLRDAIWKERTAWLATGADQRSEPDVYANAAAAWFAKRDGTVKP